MDNKFKILKVNIKRCIELVGTSLLFYFLPKTIAIQIAMKQVELKFAFGYS